MRPSFFHHLHPPTIPAEQARWRYTLGAGGGAVFLLLVVIVTGALEMFYYVPTPEQAATSVQTITFLVPLGSLIRNLHFWSAQALIIVVVLHLMRVILTGAYAPPRRFNYLLGLSLLVLCLLLNFTGYALRWDEGVRWAIIAGTNLLSSIPFLGQTLYGIVVGASQPGAATISRFYAWHIFGLLLLLIIFTVWHLFRVRRDGGIAVPPPELRLSNERISRFELVRREIIAGLLITASLIVVATIFPAPLGPQMIDLNHSATSVPDARAPWFFLWVQQLLKYGDPFWMGIVIPLSVLAVFIAIPFLFPLPRPEELGRWFPRSNRLAQVTALLLLAIILALSLWGAVS